MSLINLNESSNLKLDDNSSDNLKLSNENLENHDDSLDNSNSSNSSNKTTDDSLNIKLFSDAGIYGLCGLTSVLFYQLYPDETNRDFCKETIGALLTHLNLSSNQVKNSMFAFLDGEGGHLDDFINLLKSEEALANNSVALIEALILFAIRDGVYDARLRVLILKIADLFNIPRPLVQLHEESVIEMLSSDLPTQSDEELKEKAKRLRNKKIKKYLLIGSGTLIGGTILGLTGGLIAPAFSIAATTILGAGSAAAALGSTTGIAIIGSLFGVAGAGLGGHKMKKRVGDIEEFAFEILNEGKELCLTIAISGWISDKGEDAFKKPWIYLQNAREQYCVRYESNYLLELGKALDYFLGFAISMGVQEALKFTILSGIMAAISWPATLITFSSVIDNPWSVCVRRSAEVGRHLAEVLLSREQGKRPVTLIGFSLGARVIFFCLLELAQRENSEGIIQDAILLGAPVSGSLEYWRKFSKIVSGRLVNGYCRGDWLLKFLYRTTNASIKIAGLDSIDLKDRRMENVDLSDIVSGHLDYYKKLPEVLAKIGIQVNETELNKSNSLLKKSATGLPQLLVKDDKDYCSVKIRMAISEPNLSRKMSKDENELFESCKLERSLSLEELKVKNKKTKLRLSSTCADFKKESLNLLAKDNISINSNSSNDTSTSNKLNNSASSNEKVNKLSNNNQVDKKVTQPTRSRLSRFNILSRFSRKTENIEELNEDNNEPINEVLKDELTNIEESKLEETKETKLNNELLKESILNDSKLKDEMNNKIKDELKDAIDDKIKDENLKDELIDNIKLNELNRKNQLAFLDQPDQLDSQLQKPNKQHNNESEFLQLNVESLNFKNNHFKRI